MKSSTVLKVLFTLKNELDIDSDNLESIITSCKRWAKEDVQTSTGTERMLKSDRGYYLDRLDDHIAEFFSLRSIEDQFDIRELSTISNQQFADLVNKLAASGDPELLSGLL